MTHTAPSVLYRELRIDGHPMQLLAGARVLMWFYSHHRIETVLRHLDWLLRVLSNRETAEDRL